MLYLLILFVQVHGSCKEVFNCGHSSRVTPGLIPNPEVKPAHVGCGTQIREFSGNIQRCNCQRWIDVFVLFNGRAGAFLFSFLNRFFSVCGRCLPVRLWLPIMCARPSFCAAMSVWRHTQYLDVNWFTIVTTNRNRSSVLKTLLKSRCYPKIR